MDPLEGVFVLCVIDIFYVSTGTGIYYICTGPTPKTSGKEACVSWEDTELRTCKEIDSMFTLRRANGHNCD